MRPGRPACAIPPFSSDLEKGLWSAPNPKAVPTPQHRPSVADSLGGSGGEVAPSQSLEAPGDTSPLSRNSDPCSCKLLKKRKR